MPVCSKTMPAVATASLRRYAADGMTLAGHLTGADGEPMVRGDLMPNLEGADRFSTSASVG